MPESGFAENVGLRRERPVRPHRLDMGPDFGDDARSARVVRVQNAYRVHQFLDGDRRVIDLPPLDQGFEDFRQVELERFQPCIIATNSTIRKSGPRQKSDHQGPTQRTVA